MYSHFLKLYNKTTKTKLKSRKRQETGSVTGNDPVQNICQMSEAQKPLIPNQKL